MPYPAPDLFPSPTLYPGLGPNDSSTPHAPSTPWGPPEAPDEVLAALPFPEAQATLLGAPVPSSRVSASCGWHGTLTDPNRGSFGVVRRGGALEYLVGERVLVRAGQRSVRAYVIASRNIEEDFSLARRPFLALALLATEELPVLIEVLA